MALSMPKVSFPVVRALLRAYPDAAQQRDSKGCTPLTLLGKAKDADAGLAELLAEHSEPAAVQGLDAPDHVERVRHTRARVPTYTYTQTHTHTHTRTQTHTHIHTHTHTHTHTQTHTQTNAYVQASSVLPKATLA
jgi:hypothetical protein